MPNEEDGEDFLRIKGHVMNLIEEEEEEKNPKYKQLEFDFEKDYNLDEDLVAPI